MIHIIAKDDAYYILFNSTLENTINDGLKWNISDVIRDDGAIFKNNFRIIVKQSLEGIL